MKSSELKNSLADTVAAARAAGRLLRRNQWSVKRINSQSQHDIKLELDVRCQKLIERALLKRLPGSAVLGEEGVRGQPDAPWRWVIDPIDGTVNFAYGIPHACVSIALQERTGTDATDLSYATVLGVVYDPFCDELWTAIRGGLARLNGRVIHVSPRGKLAEAIVSIGFAKDKESVDQNLPIFNKLVRRARKTRMMGSAALALTYVASGRFDAYIESGIRLWDIAAGGLIVECAGGKFWSETIPGEHAYRLIADNGKLRGKLVSLYSA